MNKFFTLLIILMGFGITALQAQLVATPNPSIVTGSANDGIQKAHIDVENTGTTPVTVLWARLLNDIPPEWTSSICDPNLCYSPFSDEPRDSNNDLVPFTLGPGATSSAFYVQFTAANVTGIGNVRILIYDVADSLNNSVLVSFTADLVGTGIDFNSSAAEDLISIYPNPVKDIVNNIATGNADIQNIEIYNIVGKRVRTVSMQSGLSEISFDVSDLKEGIYFVRLLDRDGQLITSRRFSKVN